MKTIRYNIGETVMVPMTVIEIHAKITQEDSDIMYRLAHKGQNAGTDAILMLEKTFDENERSGQNVS